MVKRFLSLLAAIAGLLAITPAIAQHAAHGKPQLASSVAFAPDGTLWLVGTEHGKLFLQRRSSGGWEARRLLDHGDDVIATSGDNRPKLAFGPNGWVVISYTRPLSRPYTGEIRMLRSDDGGATFSAPFTVHEDRQVITHRFDSILFDARGDLYTFWIDKRDAERAWAAANGDQSAYDGAAIYYNVSTDGGKSFGPDTRLADYSCECCRIALAAEPHRGVAVLWRHVFPGSVRDHAFAIVGSQRPAAMVRASTDQWVLKACPHHGPGLARDPKAGYHAVWFGDKAGRQRVRYGRLDTAGRPQGRPVELPDAHAEHADIAVAGRTVVIVWRSFDGERTLLRAWVSQDGGRSFALRELGSSIFQNDHPRLAAQDGRIAVVWRTEDDVQVHDIR